MAHLKIRPGRSTWHAVTAADNGKRKIVNLGIPIKGKPPVTLKKEGNAAFEKSRVRAQAALDRLIEDTADPRAAIRAQQNVLRLKGGENAGQVTISEAPALAAKQTLGAEGQRQAVVSRARQFSDYMLKRVGDVELQQLTTRDIQAFYDQLQDSRSTFRRRQTELRRLLRSAFPAGIPTPFELAQTKRPQPPECVQADKLVPRKPFTPEQLERIYQAAAGTDIEPLIVIAAGTGLRKGDCCMLRWESVDIDAQVLRVIPRKTKAKSGKEVTIPLHGRAFRLLQDRLPVGDYVFPDMAALYQTGDAGSKNLRTALKRVLLKALAEPGEQPENRKLPPAEAYVRCIKVIDLMTATEKRRARMKDITRLYILERQTYTQIHESCGYSKSQCSEALKILEAETGLQIIRGAKKGTRAEVARLTTVKAKGRKQAQSVYDWHSFRTTWITEALRAGWSVADVQKVTGHAEVEIVLKHYYHPDETHLKALPVPASAAI